MRARLANGTRRKLSAQFEHTVAVVPGGVEGRDEAGMLAAAVLPRRWRLSPAVAVAAALLEGAIAGAPGVRILHNEDLQGTPFD